MNTPESLVSWLIAELEARRAEIESDCANVNSGEVVAHWNRNRGTVAVETRVTRTYRPSAGETSVT